MALLLKSAVDSLRYVLIEMKDPKTSKYILTNSPIPTVFIVVMYLLFVLELGPKYMAKRKPMQIDRIVQIYNLVQVFLCLFIAYGAIDLILSFDMLCQPISYENTVTSHREFDMCYYYWVIKFLDMFDTVFFVLRKKNNQVTFLHVYHHVMMVGSGWIYTTNFAGGHVMLVGFLNTLIHILMYSYYFLTSAKILDRNSSVKKYMTILQLIQFVFIFVSFNVAFYIGCYNRIAIFFVILQSIMMIVLFSNFYYKCYIAPSKKTQ